MTENELQTLSTLNTVIKDLIRGESQICEFETVSSDVSEPIKELSDNITLLVQNFKESQDFLSAFAKGELDVLPPKRNNLIAPFKQLHSDMLHLVWQTKEIAKGDYNQEVSFMGDFSVAYNKLIEALKEKKELEASLIKLNADKDRFITILAHDLRSPFNSILGFLDLLMKNLHKYDISEIEKFINIINNSGKNTFRLLEDLLVWVRANSGKIPYEPQELNLATICNEVIENLNLSASTKNITINYFSGHEMSVFADKNMLNTILRNLVSNSIKFTHNGGHINVFAEQDQSNITITVSDNGVGVHPNTLIKLFDISEIVTTEGTKKEKGTGLGLLLCKEFVEKHGGKFKVESELGKGCSFQFTLPKQNNM